MFTKSNIHNEEHGTLQNKTQKGRQTYNPPMYLHQRHILSYKILSLEFTDVQNQITVINVTR